MERRPSSAANTLSATKKIPGLIWNPKVRYRAHNSSRIIIDPEPDECFSSQNFPHGFSLLNIKFKSQCLPSVRSLPHFLSTHHTPLTIFPTWLAIIPWRRRQYFPRTSVSIHQTTRRHIPKDRSLHMDLNDNLILTAKVSINTPHPFLVDLFGYCLSVTFQRISLLPLAYSICQNSCLCACHNIKSGGVSFA